MRGKVAGARKLDQRGQSVIEMVLVLVILMVFSISFIKIALIFGFANYAQYATFMASRAYLSAGHEPQTQQDSARAVIFSTLKSADQRDRYPWVAQGFQGTDSGMEYDHPRYSPDTSTVWMQGVRYTFRSKLFLLPLGGVPSGRSAEMTQLVLTSESFLGREPSENDCQDNLGKEEIQGIFDNGC